MQIDLMGGGIHRLPGFQQGLLLRSQLHLNFLGDGTGNVAVERKNICRGTVEAFRPQMAVAGPIDQLNRDAEPIFAFLNASFQQPPDTKIARNLRRLADRAAKLERRISRNDESGRNRLDDFDYRPSGFLAWHATLLEEPPVLSLVRSPERVHKRKCRRSAQHPETGQVRAPAGPTGNIRCLVENCRFWPALALSGDPTASYERRGSWASRVFRNTVYVAPTR